MYKLPLPLHFSLTLTRISTFAAPCEFGLYKCHYYYYYYHY